MTTPLSQSTRPHVAQVVLWLGRGGLESMAVQLAIDLAKRGFPSSLIALDEGGEREDVLRAAGVEYHIVGRRSFRTLGYHADIRRLLRRAGVDVLHTHNLSPLLRILPGATLAGVRRIVHTEHGPAYMDDRVKLRRMLRLTSRFVSRFVLVGNRLRPYYTERVGIPADRMSVIPNGIDVDRFLPAPPSLEARAALGLPAGFVIGSAGRLTWEKNFTLLLQGVHVARQRGVNVHLALMGDGEQRAELEALAGSLGIRDAVTFLGWRTDTDRILPLLDAYVVSSATEGLPLAVLEAMASGIPIVSTPVGEMPLLLADGSAGEIYAPDPDALADVLARTAMDSARRARQGQAARLLATRHYSAATMVDAYVGAYAAPTSSTRRHAREPVGPPALER